MKLSSLFTHQEELNRVTDELLLEPENNDFVQSSVLANSAHDQVVWSLERVNIRQQYLIKNFKAIDEATIRQSNRYYVMYGSDTSVENLAWSSNRILGTCKDKLRDKVREGLVGVSPIELGDPLVLKLILDIVINMDDSALKSLTQNLQLFV